MGVSYMIGFFSSTHLLSYITFKHFLNTACSYANQEMRCVILVNVPYKLIAEGKGIKPVLMTREAGCRRKFG